MKIVVKNLSKEQLKNLIDNHRMKNETKTPLFAEALSEFQLRKGHGLTFQMSFSVIREAAKKGRFLSYKELAEASGVDWGQAHYAIGTHLWDLVQYADVMGWPMLSAIVVNKPNVNTGMMEPETLRGFVSAAKLLGYDVGEPESFLRKQQAEVFAWARGGQ